MTTIKTATTTTTTTPTSTAMFACNFVIKFLIFLYTFRPVFGHGELSLPYEANVQTWQGRGLSLEFFDFITANDTATAKPIAINDGISTAANVECMAQLNAIQQGIEQRSTWALKFADAWGHLPSALLEGNLHAFGGYEECLRLQQPLNDGQSVQGKYCFASIPLGNLLANESFKFLNTIDTATCVPAACNASYLDMLLKQFLQTNWNISYGNGTALLTESNCRLPNREPLSAVAIASIVILGIGTVIAAGATVWDYFCSYSESDLHPLLAAWSARANARQLFGIVDYSKHPNGIACLNGMRCLSLAWIICAHVCMMLLTSPNINRIDILQWLQTPLSMFFTQGFLVVDTFFFISALLLALIFLRELDRFTASTAIGINLLLLYVHRYLRLTPVLGFAILLYMSLRYFSDGPLWQALGWGDYTACEANWWATLLYVQNYVYPAATCLGFSWYLAADMQLYVLSPVLLYTLWRWRLKAVAGTLLLMLLLWACLFTTIMIKNYSMFYKNFLQWSDSFSHIYTPTHMQTSPWLIGLLCGYYLHISKGQRRRLPYYFVLLGWVVSFALLATCIFALLPKSQDSAAPLTTLEEAFFISLSRIAWPLALCWIVYACDEGYGGPINGFLSAPLWQPLARLSYCMYVFHFIFVNIDAGRVRTNTNFSNYDVLLRFGSAFIFTMLFSSQIYLLIEAPFANVEKYLLKKLKPRKRTPPAEPVSQETNDQHCLIVEQN